MATNQAGRHAKTVAGWSRSICEDGDIPAIPMPSVAHAKLIEQPTDWTSLPSPTEAFGLVFREDTFDAVSRTRRGRLYQKKEGTQPESHTVSAHPYDRGLIPGWDRATRKSMFVYRSCIDILHMPNQGQGLVLALGSSHGASAWRIVQTEALYSGAVMVTLKALSAYGNVPSRRLTVEVHLANGLPSFTLVGLADVEVKEARESCLSSMLRR